MSARLEQFLARLYVDDATWQRFVVDARGEARRAGLSLEECAAMDRVDRVGLDHARTSFRKKRHGGRASR